MKAKILNINWWEAYTIKIWDIVEIEELKYPFNIVAKYTTKENCWWDGFWKPMFQEEDVEIV